MKVQIPFAKPTLGEPEWTAVRDVIESGWVTQGPRVAEFEQATADFCGAKNAVATSSCTTALHLALICAEVGSGDEVIAPSMSFIATANAVVHAGATPVFAEVDPQTFNLDVEDVRKRITSKTRAILFADQLGIPARIDELAELAGEYDLKLIEDAACAIGSAYRGKPIGSHCEWVCFSFHPRKLLTTGDGGMIMTPSAEHAERLRRLRHHGMSISDVERNSQSKFGQETYAEIGYNYRLSDVQAAMGLVQLKRLPANIEARRARASDYASHLEGHPIINPPLIPDDVEWNVQTYAVRLTNFSASQRNQVAQSLLDAGIATRAGVATTHRQPAYVSREGRVRLPISEGASDGSLQLPMHAELSPDDCAMVSHHLIEAVERWA